MCLINKEQHVIFQHTDMSLSLSVETKKKLCVQKNENIVFCWIKKNLHVVSTWFWFFFCSLFLLPALFRNSSCFFDLLLNIMTRKIWRKYIAITGYNKSEGPQKDAFHQLTVCWITLLLLSKILTAVKFLQLWLLKCWILVEKRSLFSEYRLYILDFS